MAIDWSDIYSKRVKDAFREALSDKQLTDDEVVEVLRTVLSDGDLTGTEVNDLQKIAHAAATIPPRGKFLLLNLAKEVLDHLSYGQINFSTSRQQYAVEILCDFLKRKGPQSFPHLDRSRVGVDLLLRVANPNIINQRQAGVCGPVAFLYGLAFDSPAAYARMGIDLFENGRAKVGRMDVSPGSDCRNYSPPDPLSHGEWVTAGSLRDSENLFLDYDDVDKNRAGGTGADEVAHWFEKAGYTDVHYDHNRFYSMTESDVEKINGYYNNGYRMALSINAKLLDAKTQAESSSKSNHLVVLRSPIQLEPTAKMTIYTWGNVMFQVPQGGPLTKSQLLEHLYGWVAAKPF